MENQGQVDQRVRYYEKGAGLATYFTEDGISAALFRPVETPGADRKASLKSAKAESIKIGFPGASKEIEIQAEDRLEWSVNYF